MNNAHQSEKRESRITHQRQFFWQILAPILVSLIVVLIILVLVVMTAGKQPAMNEKWSDISTIILTLPALLLGLLTTALIIIFSVMIKKLHQGIPAYTGKLQNLISSMNRVTNISTTKALSPIIQSKAWYTGFKRLLSIAFHSHNDRKE